MKTLPVENAAEAFIECLNAQNVDYIFLNPGNDTVPLQEAVAKFKALGKRTPQIMLHLDEMVAMSAAQGYYWATHKPQMVLVHVDVGTLQTGVAIHNAQQNRIGMLFCAGIAPATFEGEKKGGRENYVQWSQDQFNQPGIVRDYVKWFYELRCKENMHHVINRAFQVARTEPCGPVYLTFSRELLLEEITSVAVPDVNRYSGAVSPQADEKALAAAADILRKAENPLIIAGYSGRHTESVPLLVELAETLGAKVVVNEFCMNFPTTHPLYSGGEPGPYFKETDAYLIIDLDIPYAPIKGAPNPQAKIIQLDMDPIKRNMPMWGFPVDLLLEGNSCKTLPVLTRILREKATPTQKASFNKRRVRIEKENGEQKARWRQIAEDKADQKPISAEWLSYCIDQVVGQDAIILNETITSSPTVSRQINRSVPGTIFTNVGSGLGMSLGAAIGIKLAKPEKTVVALMGDGGFNFGCPVAALWASNAYKAPFLCIIYENGCYNAVRMHHRAFFDKDSYLEKVENPLGVSFFPAPDYVALAKSCYAAGYVVEDPAAIQTVLKQALMDVKNGKTAIVDVKIAKPLPR